MMRTYWVGWNVPIDVPEDHKIESWPDGMRGWESGWGDTYTTWVGRVDAVSAEDAWAVVLGCYGASRDRIAKRWEPKPHTLGWRPGDRFPEP